MKTEKKIKFNPKSGMALPGVLVLLLVLSMLGTAMYAYSMQSVQSVRFASDGKKAEYLAQAGVQAAAYAFQAAMDSKEKAAVEFTLEAGKTDNTVASNRVWLVYNKTLKDYEYIRDTGSNAAPENDNYKVVGSFVVNVESKFREDTVVARNYKKVGDNYVVDKQKEVPIYSPIRIFRAVGTAGSDVSTGATRAKVGYLFDSKNANGVYYGKQGIIDGKYTGENDYGGHATPLNAVTTGNADDKFTPTSFYQSGSFEKNTTLQYKFKWLSALGISDPEPQTVESETIPFALAYSGGNYILDPPDSERPNIPLSFQTGQSNMVSFVSNENIYVRSSIDTTSSDGFFNTLVLKGRKIIIDGNIITSAYSFTRANSYSLALMQNIATLSDLINAKYRLSTVSIDALSSVDNPYTEAPYDYLESGMVYFGGDVYVNIEFPNVGTYSYKAFSAGDVYYFDANVRNSHRLHLELSVDSESSGDYGNTSSDGIDLFRYFLEYSIATRRYSNTVLERFEDLIDFYYGNNLGQDPNEGNAAQAEEKSIHYSKGLNAGVQKGLATGMYLQWYYDVSSAGHPISRGKADMTGIKYNSMRKIKTNFNDSTLLNNEGDSLVDTIPPSPSDVSAISWGEPKMEGLYTADEINN